MELLVIALLISALVLGVIALYAIAEVKRYYGLYLNAQAELSDMKLKNLLNK